MVSTSGGDQGPHLLGDLGQLQNFSHSGSPHLKSRDKDSAGDDPFLERGLHASTRRMRFSLFSVLTELTFKGRVSGV